MRRSTTSRHWLHGVPLAVGLLLSGCQGTLAPRADTSASETVVSHTLPTDTESDRDGPPQPRTPQDIAAAPVDAGAAPRSPARDVMVADTAMPAGLPTATAAPNTMVAHFIDVGQGDATLLEFSCAAVLIDTGGENTARVSGRDRLSRYLEDFFERRADLARTLHLVVLSHPHKDHTDGVSVLLDAEPAIVVMNVLDNGPPAARASGGKGQRDLQAYAAEIEGVGYAGMAESDITTVSGATSEIIDPVNCKRGNAGVDPRISVLWGRVDLDTAWANDANNDSVVVRVAFGKAVFLFTGDLESQGIAAMLESYAADLRVFDADVLKVGHHGSHNATTADFVTAVTPKIAVIQSGESSPDDERFSAYAFGHPNAKALTLLLDADNGVSFDRASPKLVRVGLKGRSISGDVPPDFTHWTMKKAIYANGWDGNIAIKATSDGRLSVETEY